MFPHLIYYLSDKIKLLTLDLQTCLIHISKARVNLTHEQYHAFPLKKQLKNQQLYTINL